MDLLAFHTLLTPSGQQAIARAAELDPAEDSFLPALTKLQKQFPAELAKAALETVRLRHKARPKFTRAEAMYFTRAGLEMASGEIVSRYRAARFTPFEHVADLGCGIGGDTLGLASRLAGQPETPAGGEAQTTAVDIDSLHLAMARENLAAYGLRADFIESDLTRAALPPADAAFFDPGRRAAGGRRLFSVRDYEPPLAQLQAWLPLPLGVKISPGVNLKEIEAYDCEIEFISLDGDLKECALWFGPLKIATRRATRLSAQAPPLSLTAADSAGHPAPLSLPRAYLYEPDPSILRAGLVACLAARLHAAQLDPDIAYLTSDTFTPTPWASAFAIEADLPFSQKRLREKLQAMNVGRVTVKKRGSPLDPQSFARALKLKGDEERLVFLTHVDGRPWALIGTRVTQGELCHPRSTE